MRHKKPQQNIHQQTKRPELRAMIFSVMVIPIIKLDFFLNT